MVENSERPKEYDAVLGGQNPPPVGGVVLGGLQGLRRRFAFLSVEERVTALSDALKYGEAGIDWLIEAMNDEALLVRANAYKLLYIISSIKAKKAIANGVLLNPGDKLYSVYRSALYYGDDFYCIIDYLCDEDNESLGPHPQFVSRHLFRENAEIRAELVHKQRILEVNFSTINAPYPTQYFKTNQWCQENKISLKRQRYENYWDFLEKIINHLQKNKDSEILKDLLNQLGYRRLAFVCEEILEKKTYYKVKGNT